MATRHSAIFSGGKIKSTAPDLTALFGMLSKAAEPSSWANVKPPYDFITCRPSVPSSNAPDNTTPTAKLWYTIPNEEKKRSTVLPFLLFLSNGASIREPSTTVTTLFCGIMYR